MSHVMVIARMYGGTYIARAGHGRAAKRASCTASSLRAARLAASKYLDCHEDNVRLRRESIAPHEGEESYSAEIFEQKAWTDLPPAAASDVLIWRYVADGDLPDADTSVLIATDDPDSDEVLLGNYDGEYWRTEGGVAGIYHTVYAWAPAPAKPPKKGAAS